MYISFYSDIDECNNGTHNCSQICTNTNGSFNCGCKNGYHLHLDEVTCNGMYKMWIYIQLYSYLIIISSEIMAYFIIYTTNECIIIFV